MKHIVTLISGRGSNLEALLISDLPARFAAVITNNPQAKGLDIARKHGIATEVIDHHDFADRSAFDRVLAQRIRHHKPDLVVLAGFMRILTDEFVRIFAGRLINIHPSLLPAFPGTHTHRRALQEGVKVHGCTVHFVTSTLDGGPIIAQAAVPVFDKDNEESLAARVLTQEHRLLPAAVRWFLEDRLRVNGMRVHLSCAPKLDSVLISPTLS